MQDIAREIGYNNNNMSSFKYEIHNIIRGKYRRLEGKNIVSYRTYYFEKIM